MRRLKPHDVYVIDPPWPTQRPKKNQGRYVVDERYTYDTMSLVDIEELLRQKILPDQEGLALKEQRQTQVFLWSVDSMVFHGDTMMAALGYRFHARLIWDKGNGFPSHAIRHAHEYLTWYYTGLFLPPASGTKGKYASVFHAPSRQHSRKPNIAYDMISTLYPSLRKADIFSREKRKGWSTWGNQTNKMKEK